jgi:carbon storage regulator
MLVLTRRPGESIIIGNGIKLTVVTVGPGRVKIGIDAPPNVRIDREEIHTRIQQEQEQAADVLAAVQATAAGMAGNSGPNTIMNSGSSTEVLTNRIADQMAVEPIVRSGHPAPDPPPPSASGISRYRLPRKPR